MALLGELVEAAPGTVPRGHLLERHWPAHVTDDALHRAIWKLRRALRQIGAEEALVETVPKVGYRLRVRAGVPPISPPRAGDTPPPREGTTAQTLAGERFRGFDRRRAAGFAAMLLTLLAALAVATRGPRDGGPPVPKRPSSAPVTLDTERATPRTALPGYESSPTYLADGRLVFGHYAKEGARAGQWDLFSLAADGSISRLSDDPVDVPTGELVHQLGTAADPSGRWLAYLRVVGDDCRVVLHTPGGDRELLGCGTGQAQAAERWPELAWGPGGALYFSDRRGPGEPRRIWRLEPFVESASDGALANHDPLQITHPDIDDYGDLWPAPSPEGRRLAFVRAPSPGLDDLWLRDLTTGAERQLTFDGANLGGCAWSADGASLLFSSRRSGSFRLWSLELATGSLTALAAPGGHLSAPRAVPGGFLVEEWQSQVNLWRLVIEGPGQARAEPWITSTRWSLMPALSPSGEQLAFLSDRDGTMGLWLAEPGEQGMITRRSSDLELEGLPRLAWSPGGDALVFDLQTQGSFDLHRLDLGSGTLERLTRDASNERNPFYSPDGQRLVFASDRGQGWQLWSLELSTGALAPLTTDGAFAARPSPDGEWIYLVRHRTPGIWRRSTTAPPQVPSEPWVVGFPAADWLAWSVVQDGVAFLRRARTAGGATELWVRDSAGERPLMELDGPEGTLGELWTDSSLLVSPDLRQVALASIDHSASDIWFLPGAADPAGPTRAE